MKHTTTQFDFSAKPKVTALKPKYRQRQQERLDGTSLMNDPRIIRGNTYAAMIANKNEIQPPPKRNQARDTKKKPMDRRINFDTGFQPTTPRALDGRQHFTTQTQPFVETLRDKPIQYQKQCQTDLFLDRPAERLFNALAQKTGTDRITQVDENDPELFNFDYEVQPILEALLGKVMETCRMQLHQQAEMQAKQKEKKEYEKRRHILLAEAQQLQSNQNRLRQQYERRQLQYRKSKEQQGFLEKKIISRILSKQYLKNIQQNTESILQHHGFFRNPLELDMLQQFLPWLYDEVLCQLQQEQKYKNQAEKIIKQSESDIIQRSKASILKQKSKREALLAEKQKKNQERLAKKEARRKAKEQEEKRKKLQEEQARKAEEQAQQNPPQAAS